VSQLVSQHLRESLDFGETFEADERIDRIRSRTRPGELDVPGAEPDDRDVPESRGIDVLDMEDSDSSRRHLERGDHLDVKDVGGGSGPFPQPSQRGRAWLSGWVGRTHDLLDRAPDADVSLRETFQDEARTRFSSVRGIEGAGDPDRHDDAERSGNTRPDRHRRLPFASRLARRPTLASRKIGPYHWEVLGAL
jgi:hypothetical protein